MCLRVPFAPAPALGRALVLRATGHGRREGIRSFGMALTLVDSLDTLLLSYLLIAYLGPVFGLEHSKKEALGTAGLIATAEVVTKMVLYY